MRSSMLAEVADEVDEIRDGLVRGLEDVRRELQRLSDLLDAAPFVRRELHDEQIRDLRETVRRVASHAQWTFGLVASSIISGIIVFAVSIAQGG